MRISDWSSDVCSSDLLPLGWHPRNRNALIVCDLQARPEPLLQETAETLRQRLYTRRDQLADGELPVPLKLVHVNKCPVVAPLKVLRTQDIQRLGLDMSVCHERAAMLREQRQIWSTKLEDIYREDRFAGTDDPEQQLYDGFLGDRDRRLRSEEHTSELQSLMRNSYAVFCLKKKTN